MVGKGRPRAAGSLIAVAWVHMCVCPGRCVCVCVCERATEQRARGGAGLRGLAPGGLATDGAAGA